ncbi:hypothetical protein DNTS_001326 [Danionella cerebrum]|uniref:Uncharacterized protein n=1 Tax=Danionella cerebrum TaxID=2873325 RepID=A0A553Q3U2_9TELE|nr:hypothetical protein DNTS_001326 [Danionella translucida]
MYCVLADRLDCAEVLLKTGVEINKTDHSQRTALHLAAQKGNVRFMKLLLSRRADWRLKDLEEMTPLHLATRHSSPKALSLLLKHMAPGEVDTQDRNKQTALHWSAFYNHPEHVKLLIRHDSNIGIPDSEGKIPLHWAAHNKHPNATQTVRCILDAAPTESLLNWQDYEGRTPLHFAVADGNEAVVDVLTSYEGCSVTAYDNLFRTPLHWAALLGHAKIVHLLLERNKSGMIPSDSQGATPLHYGAQSNFADTVAVFLKHPSVRDEPDLEGRTAFMWAAGKGSDDVIKIMLDLKKDLDISMTDKYGGTALHAAALSGHVSTVCLLLEQGAVVDPVDVMKHTPLFRACEMGHRDVILTLIKGGARVDLVDIDGHSALHWAALGGNVEVCEVLMENGISPNLQDHAGRTPLQCAAYAGYINCMALLIQHDADPNIQDKEGRTALHWSCNNGYLDAVKLLLGCGAFPNHMEHTEESTRHGALSIAAIQDIAASSIQSLYKGYKVRRAFRERKKLLMRHEQLRKDAAKKREEERRREAEQHLSLAEVEQKQRILLAEVQNLSLDETEQKVKDSVLVREHKQNKSLAAQKVLNRTERRMREPETSVLPLTSSYTQKASGSTEEMCVTKPCAPDTDVPEKRGSTLERRSPAGSSRPGSAHLPITGVHVTPCHKETTRSPKKHNKPRATDTHSKPTAQESVRLIYSKGNSVHRPTGSQQSNTHPSSDTRQKERRTDRDEDKRPSTERQNQKCTGTEKDQLRLMRRTKKKQGEAEKEKKSRGEQAAAVVIQRAWRRSRLRWRLRKALQRDGKGVEPAEVRALLIQILWGWPAPHSPGHYKHLCNQTPPTRNPGKKSSVLQNIYGGIPSKRGQCFREAALRAKGQTTGLLDLPIRTHKQMSPVESVSLADSLNQVKHFSYHLRPSSDEFHHRAKKENQ